jgi:trk system potassium uptake protein TrkH
MQYQIVAKVVGFYLYAFSLLFIIPLFLALYYHFVADPMNHPQPHTSLSFLISSLITVGLAFCCHYYGKSIKESIYRREGLLIVVLIWIITPAISALPFWISGTLKNPLAAYFEAMSGLTTTGSTAMSPKKYDSMSGKEIPIITVVKGEQNITYAYYGTIEPVRDAKTNKILFEGIEAVSKALLFWRAFIQWIGGVGIVVLFVAILPLLGVGGKVLFHTEMPGPIKETLTPRIKETAIQLWKIYFGLTFLQIVLLKITNYDMEWLDAVTTSFATLSTGGFSIRNASMAYYDNAYTEWIVIVFMLLGSINFSLYYFVIKGKLFKLYEPELICYLILVFVLCAYVSWNLMGTYEFSLASSENQILGTHKAIRYGCFQLISAISTTGFAIANYDKWPYVVQTILLIVMFVGGMSGSTAGGIKIMRQYILCRLTFSKIKSLYQPKGVQIFKIGDKEVDNNALIMVLCFFVVMITVSVLGVSLYVIDGIDPETALGLVACMVNSTGQSFRAAGPTESCAFLSNFGYILSSLLMLLGRLEFFAIFALLTPSFWKK